MKVLLREWNHILQAPASEEATLRRLDSYNKTRYSRRKNQEGLLEIASREAHKKRKTYFATILKDDNTPYCAIETNAGYFGIDFLREDFDNYLMYDYRDEYSKDGCLFLGTVILHECHPGTNQKRRRIDFRLDPKGLCERVRYSDDDGSWALIVDPCLELSTPEIERLWVPYPEFGQYEGLFRLDRIPMVAQQRILEYTDREFPAFREYLQRDIELYQML